MPLTNPVDGNHQKKAPYFFEILRRFGAGLIIGIACITPGLSGGVIAASAGLYEPALHAITHLFKQF